MSVSTGSTAEAELVSMVSETMLASRGLGSLCLMCFISFPFLVYLCNSITCQNDTSVTKKGRKKQKNDVSVLKFCGIMKQLTIQLKIEGYRRKKQTIKYAYLTQKGDIGIHLERVDNAYRILYKDDGVGISQKEIKWVSFFKMLMQ